MISPKETTIAFPDIVANAQVHHPDFGVGKVVMRTGTDENSKAVVKFKEEGEKKLALRFARLIADRIEEEPVEGEKVEAEEEK